MKSPAADHRSAGVRELFLPFSVTRVTWCRLVAWLLPAAIVALLSGPAAAQRPEIRIVEHIWGFDGRVMPGQFNPLSVLLDNLSDQPIEGKVTLRSISGLVRDAGGVLVEPIYLGPTSRRWVQFYPWISDRSHSWRLAVESGDQTVLSESIDQSRPVLDFGFGADDQEVSRHVAVILDSAGLLNRMPTALRHMPAEVFPPYATAMSGLRVLFLDHVPDWETPRQEALLSWLKCGGQLHLLHDRNGLQLRFSAVLSPLNQPFPSFSVGAGRVVRHALQREQLDESTVHPLIRRGRDVRAADSAQIAPKNPAAASFFGTSDPAAIDNQLITGMRELTQPEHAWWLIFLLSLGYIALIFPGCWLLSQKRTLHFLTTYAAIAGLAVVFSLLFLLIGQRGYGESTVLHTVAVARSEDPTHWNCLQTNHLFVTSGDTYLISSENEQALFASGNTDEAVDAVIRSGNSGQFDVRIPPFSSQSILTRRRVTLPDWELSVRETEVLEDRLVRLVLSVGGEFPKGDLCEYLVLYRDQLYLGALTTDGTELRSGTPLQTLRDFALVRPDANPGGFLFGVAISPDDKRSDQERFYQDSRNALVHRSLLDDGIADPAEFLLQPDRVRLMVYAPVPDSMQLTVSTSSRQEGRILYVRDVLLPSEP